MKESLGMEMGEGDDGGIVVGITGRMRNNTVKMVFETGCSEPVQSLDRKDEQFKLDILGNKELVRGLKRGVKWSDRAR